MKECFKADNLRNLVPDEEVVDGQELERVVRIGLWCIQEEPNNSSNNGEGGCHV